MCRWRVMRMSERVVNYSFSLCIYWFSMAFGFLFFREGLDLGIVSYPINVNF